MEFLSHPSSTNGNIFFPQKLLKDHLGEVGRGAAEYINSLSICHKMTIRVCAYIAGISHDFGKYTSFFQAYLQNKEKTEVSQHAFISSIFAFYIANNVLDSNNPNTKYMPLLVYFAVKHHHGNLTTLDEGLPRKQISDVDSIMDPETFKKIKNLDIQIKDLRKNKEIINSELKSLIDGISSYGFESSKVKILDFLGEGWLKSLNEIVSSIRVFLINYNKTKDISYYLYFIILFSALIDGDKRSAGRIPDFERTDGISRELVETYINELKENKKKNFVDEIREKLSQTVSDNLKSIGLKDRIFTLTAPTGAGKTISAIKAAVEIKNKIMFAEGRRMRIVYALPFTSIVDQTYDVFREILCKNSDYIAKSERYLIRHHHLADFETKIEENEYFPLDLAVSLTESWDSEIIVTTFVQLFHSIIGNKNRMMKKVHRIANSVIILDEVQTIRVELWAIIGEVIKQMAERFKCFFILMTATQPHILDRRISKELGFNYFPEVLDRTSIICTFAPVTLHNIVDEVMDNVKEGKNILVIRNTINSSISTYLAIKNQLLVMSENDTIYHPKLFYLSTNITPKDRAIRINEIRNSLKSAEKVVVVSTQVIEAGIDLDFDYVIRDIAPIDSIIQAAGRCNRSGWRGETSTIHIINEYDEKSKSNEYSNSSKIVYGKQALDITIEVLKKFNGKINEKDFPKLIELYFEEISKRNLIDLGLEHNKLINAMARLEFDSRDEQKRKYNPVDFSLLEEVRPMVDLFVVKREEDQSLLDRYENIVLQEINPVKRKMKMLEFRSEFRQRIISVDKEFVISIGARSVKDGDQLFVLDSGVSEMYYDNETGLKRNGESFITL